MIQHPAVTRVSGSDLHTTYSRGNFRHFINLVCITTKIRNAHQDKLDVKKSVSTYGGMKSYEIPPEV